MKNLNAQENFWVNIYGDEYIERNSKFDVEMCSRIWRKMLRKATDISSFCEFGPNIGRNVEALNAIYPDSISGVVEINAKAIDIMEKKNKIDFVLNSSITDQLVFPRTFNITFTSTVLIHVYPDLLDVAMKNLFDASDNYILISEFFSPVLQAVEYKNRSDVLFKQDFGRIFFESFPVKVLDYGFHWGLETDNAGFCNENWWLFEKI